MKFFSPDSPLSVALNRIADLIALNIVFVVTCIPIVTIGAACTSIHYVTLSMVKNEHKAMLQSYIKSFRENFKQATVIWMIYIAAITVYVIDIRISMAMGLPVIVMVIINSMMLIVVATAMYVFPVLSRFNGTVKTTLRNAFFMSIINLPWTFLLFLIYCIPVIGCFISWMFFPIFLMLGFSGSVYLAALIWKRIFSKYENTEDIEQSAE